MTLLSLGGMTEAESEEERKARRAAKEVVEEVRLMREEVRRRRALVSLPGATYVRPASALSLIQTCVYIYTCNGSDADHMSTVSWWH